MSDLFTGRHDQEEPAPPVEPENGSSFGQNAGGAAVPTSVPEGQTHLEYAMGEAAAAFERGEWSAGLANLAHSVFIANRSRALPDTAAIGLVRRVLGSSYHPELPGVEGDRPMLDHTYAGMAENLATGIPERISGSFKMLYEDGRVAILDNGEGGTAGKRWMVRGLDRLERVA